MGIGRQRPPRQVAYSTYLPAEFSSTDTMDAIRKKMKSLKDETDQLYAIIQKFEDVTKEANRVADQADCDIRDYGKKVHGFEIEFDETLDKLNKANEQFEEKDKLHKEEEANTVTKLAVSSKEADDVLKKVKVVESKCMNNEVTLEELDKNLRQTTKMASDNEQKLDELSRKLGVQEEELKRAIERAELAESKLKGIEEELQMVGENMKQLELSAEKAVEREEKLKDKILSIQNKFKSAEGRYEYGEMNITKLNQRIDDIEDEIYREKLKIKKVSDELGETFDDMLDNY